MTIASFIPDTTIKIDKCIYAWYWDEEIEYLGARAANSKAGMYL